MKLADIASWETLMSAFGRAALGKRGRGDAEAFRAKLDDNLGVLQRKLLSGNYTPASMRCFSIRDPKPRIIHAPAFRDRVVHHAMIEHMGSVLDSTLIDNTFACRVAKGSHAAVRRAAYFAAKSCWFVHADVSQYFANIDHSVLKSLLKRKFSDHDLLQLVDVVVDSHGDGEGLPIGALTSQYFANIYLGSADRFISTHPKVSGYVRYMDDMVWWCESKEACDNVLSDTAKVLALSKLVLKVGTVSKQSRNGFTFCGFRILPGRVLMSRRGRSRIRSQVTCAENAFACGLIDELELQRQVDSVMSPTQHAQSEVWLRRSLLTESLHKDTQYE